MYPYSDGSPAYEFGVAVLLLWALGAVGLILSARLGVAVRRLAERLRRIGLFSETISLKAEVYRLDMLRIVIGTMTVWHYRPEFVGALALHNRT
jgi:hypothetical protein